MEKTEKLLEVSVVAKKLSVSVDTVRRMINDDDNPLQGVRLSKKCIRVTESSVASLITARSIKIKQQKTHMQQ